MLRLALRFWPSLFTLAMFAVFIAHAHAQVAAPKSFTPAICAGATGLAADVCVSDGDQQIPWATINRTTHALTLKGSATGMLMTSAFADFQTALNAVGGAGARLNIPFGVNSNPVSAPLILGLRTNLTGQCTEDCGMFFPTRTGADFQSMFTEADFTSTSNVGVTLRDLAVDGCGAQDFWCSAIRSIPVLMHFDGRNFRIQDSEITNCGGASTGIEFDNTLGVDWLHYITGNAISGCNIGIKFLTSDSRIIANALEGNGTNLLLQTTGGVVAAFNQLDVSLGDALIIRNGSTGPQADMLVIGNYFNQNGTTDIHYQKTSGSFMDAAGPVGLNLFAATATITLDQDVRNTPFIGNVHTDNSRACDFTFHGPDNTGVSIFGDTFNQSPAARFCQLPPDAQVISGGSGGPYNRLQSLVLAAPGNAPPAATPDTRLEVYGNDTFLGSPGRIARFGIARNTSGADSALLIGNSNGNAPYLDCASGETTVVTECDFLFSHGGNLAIVATGMIERMTTAATSTTTGAIVDGGGLGVAGAAYFGGAVVVTTLAGSGTAAACLSSTGQFTRGPC